jgi:hypothetical protein
MAANFPSSVVQFTTKTNLVDTVYAAHINALQEETVSIQNVLTTNILNSAYTSTFAQTQSWTTLNARLLNIEGGLVNGVTAAPYPWKTTGNTFTPPAGSVAISITAPSSGSANLLEATVSGVTKFRIKSDGTPYVNDKEVLYDGSTLQTTMNTAITTNATALTNLLHPLLLIG